MPLSSLLFFITEYIGLATMAISGAIIAIEKRLDMVGVWFLSLMSALGGGVLRDVLLGDFPPRFFRNYPWVLVVTIASMAVFLLAKTWRSWWKPTVKAVVEKINNIFDAIGLAAFTLSGVQLALEAGHVNNVLICTFMGTVTGIGGGIMRDVMVMQTPMVLRKRVYATAAILGAVLYWGMIKIEIPLVLSWIIGMLLIVGIRVLATVFHWNMPHADEPQGPESSQTEKEQVLNK